MIRQPGESLKPHKTLFDLLFVFLTGTPPTLVGEEEVVCGNIYFRTTKVLMPKKNMKS
jgi:hypothetical protein